MLATPFFSLCESKISSHSSRLAKAVVEQNQNWHYTDPEWGCVFINFNHLSHNHC